jgi:hypothetical protein
VFVNNDRLVSQCHLCDERIASLDGLLGSAQDIQDHAKVSGHNLFARTFVERNLNAPVTPTYKILQRAASDPAWLDALRAVADIPDAMGPFLAEHYPNAVGGLCA